MKDNAELVALFRAAHAAPAAPHAAAAAPPVAPPVERPTTPPRTCDAAAPETTEPTSRRDDGEGATAGTRRTRAAPSL